MADDTLPRTSDHPGSGREPSRGSFRGPRDGRDRDRDREPGGFRIRLSDNEMQAARALQEAFGLRSTVAVLGFSLRTLAQLLEAGQLDELVAQQRAQGGSRGPEAGRREGGGERRPGREEGRGGEGSRGARANPFARPSRPPVPVAAEAIEAETPQEAELENETASEADSQIAEAADSPDDGSVAAEVGASDAPAEA